MGDASTSVLETLALRERYRKRYWETHDPILEDRLLWRAQTMRHLVHLLPGQSILELGCGANRFTRALSRVSRGENPITSVSFDPAHCLANDLDPAVEQLTLKEFPGRLRGRHFDFVVAHDLLDRRLAGSFLSTVHELLEPGGELVFYESNPWNPVLKLRRSLTSWLSGRDPRELMSRPDLYELMSELGFVRVFAVFNDFVYKPFSGRLAWLFRNSSILLENAPVVRRLAGAILIHAQKPPRTVERPRVSLCTHESLFGAISVVIPCYNEEVNVGPLIDRLRAHFDDYLHEIIPVDDNSTDGTRALLESMAKDDPRIKPVIRTPPGGVGRALADGYKAATGRYVLSMDCDFQHLLPEIRDLFDAAAEGYDVVVGSRFSRHSVLLNYPFQKIVANRGFHLLARLTLLRTFRDLTNNLKLIRKEVLDDIQLTQPGFAVNAETGLLPLARGWRVKEVPISWINRTPDMGTSSFRLAKVGGGYWKVLLDLWKEKARGSTRRGGER